MKIIAKCLEFVKEKSIIKLALVITDKKGAFFN